VKKWKQKIKVVVSLLYKDAEGTSLDRFITKFTPLGKEKE